MAKKTDKDGTEIIDLTEKKTVYATKDAPHHELGAEISVHPKVAASFIEKGFATEKAPAGVKPKGKTGKAAKEDENNDDDNDLM